LVSQKLTLQPAPVACSAAERKEKGLKKIQYINDFLPTKSFHLISLIPACWPWQLSPCAAGSPRKVAQALLGLEWRIRQT